MFIFPGFVPFSCLPNVSTPHAALYSILVSLLLYRFLATLPPFPQSLDYLVVVSMTFPLNQSAMFTDPLRLFLIG